MPIPSCDTLLLKAIGKVHPSSLFLHHRHYDNLAEEGDGVSHSLGPNSRLPRPVAAEGLRVG